jgi:hypothetical protein
MMVDVLSHFAAGDYRYLASPGRPFSGGVLADARFDLVHAVFARPLPLDEGLAAARRHVESAGRPVTALAAFELRIPEPLTSQGFAAFNAPYVERMAALGLRHGDDLVTARTNVAPTVPGITAPVVYAFTYTAPSARRTGPAFRLSGSTETTRDGSDADRLSSIVIELERRLAELGASWEDVTDISVYGAPGTPVGALAGVFGTTALHGLTWFPSRPPILDADFEMDATAAGTELVL